MKYETVIGLEIHAELDTATKIYCSCTTAFGGEENSHCCPVCTGMPGVLPALNQKAVEYCVKAGLALNCRINQYSRQDRKHYFYPDLPKAFQTSQYDQPLCIGGYVDITVDDRVKRIGITRIHIEEDAGKLIHGQGGTRIDYNRCGVPLIEIVTEPDFRSSGEVRVFLEELRNILLYTGVSNCKMEEGSLRCDVNLSIRPEGQKEFGTRTEMKNLNSFSGAYRAVEYERARQLRVIGQGGSITQDTLRWDDAKGINYAMRTKEDADDYFYFPEPDIMPMVLSKEKIEDIRASLPVLPSARREKYLELGISLKDARQLTGSMALSDLLDGMLEKGAAPKSAANLILSDVNRLLNEKEMAPEDLAVTPQSLCALLEMIDKGAISRSIGSKVMELMFELPDRHPAAIVEEKGLGQVSDGDAIMEMCKQVVQDNPKAVADYKGGKEKAMTSLVGQVMRSSKGKANPAMVNQLLAQLME